MTDNDDGWALDLTPPEGIGSPRIRERMETLMENRRLVNTRAREIFDEQGWEAVSAWAARTVDANKRLVFLVNLGWLLGDGPSGVFNALNARALNLAANPRHHETAITLRLLALSCASTGPPGSAFLRDPAAVSIANLLDGIHMALPTEEDWETANVDAALSDAVMKVEWSQADERG